MNFSSLSIKHPVPAILLFLLLTLAGLLGFKSMGIQDFPDVEMPVVTVSAQLPGAAPATLETEVARKLENSIATLSRIKKIITTILDGEVTISIEFELEKNLTEAESDVRSAVSQIRADLPADLREPVVSRITTSGLPVITGTVSSDKLDEEALSWLVDDAIARRLLAIKGVGKVKRVGGLTREVWIELDPIRMAALKVSALDISRQLRQAQLEAPAGRGDVGGVVQTVRTVATTASAEELANLDMALPDGRQIRLSQIANVHDTTGERRSLALYDGKPVVAFEVTRSRGASEVLVADGVRQAFVELRNQYPDVKIEEAIENDSAIKEGFDGSMTLLYEGALLAVIVVWCFLRDNRATFVSAMALPLSVIPSFLGMAMLGFTLNGITLLALSLVVGILVDDAIVEIENISRHLRMGKSAYQAAMEAADEIGMAVIATTFTLVAVFMPTAFMSGVTGRFFKQFGWTAVLAILASLLVARLITPMMAAYLMKDSQHHEEQDGRVMRWYLRSVRWCLSHRLITCLAAGLFFVGSMALIPLLPKGFVPASDRMQTYINIELPPGSSLEQTRIAAENARLALADIGDIKHVFSSIGGGSSGDGFSPGAAAEARRAVLTIRTTHHSERPYRLSAIEKEIRTRMADQPGVKVTVGTAEIGTKMQLILKSDDPARLAEAAHAVEQDLRKLNNVGNISSSASLVRPEIIVRPDFARAADMGVTAASISDTLRIATSGDYDMELAKLNLAQRQVPIRVQLPLSQRTDLDTLAHLYVPGKNGAVLLTNVASLAIESGPAQIDRLNRLRNVTLDVELGERQLGDVYAEALQLPSLKNLPAGVQLAESGDTEVMQELFSSFGTAMAIGVLCIYMVLVLLFHDFLQPLTILAALPLSIGGAFVLLLLTGNSFSMPSLIGLLMLMGIVTKNSILLVEYAIVAREGLHGGTPMNRFDALVDACHKRARPIIMTTLAMGAGMMPVALGWGKADPSFNSPMAIAVIGGLITSTMLSLLVVPAVFTYVDDLEHGLGWLVKKLRRHHGNQAQTAAVSSKDLH